MNDTVTILGRVGNDPTRSATTTGVPVVNFRVASPQSRYDSKAGRWVDTGTNWYTVSAFRQLADHVKASVNMGDGVIVTGRLKVRSWESNGKKGTSVDLEAESVGHDLRWGSSAFARATRIERAPEAAPEALRDADGDNAVREGDREHPDEARAPQDRDAEFALAGGASEWDTPVGGG